MCKPDKLIEAIRKSFIGAEQVYTNGSCVMFHYILKTAFPSAKPYWSEKAKHMISKIGNSYYDISGKVKCTADYKVDNKQEYSSVPLAVAFPQRTQRRLRFTTPQKI